MSKKKKSGILWDHANVVGTLHTTRGFAAAKKFADLLDLVELRVDCHPRPPALEDLAVLSVPILLTVRRHDEGGALMLSDEQRVSLYRELLPAAAAVDIEVRSLSALGEIVQMARRARKPIVASFHDFQTTPTVAKMKAMASRARDGGADVVKIAARADTPTAVARLLEAMEKIPGPLAVMGMGLLGRSSRLLFAQAGSVLNYGWLDKPQVSGQWGAVEFRRLLNRLEDK